MREAQSFAFCFSAVPLPRGYSWLPLHLHVPQGEGERGVGTDLSSSGHNPDTASLLLTLCDQMWSPGTRAPGEAGDAAVSMTATCTMTASRALKERRLGTRKPAGSHHMLSDIIVTKDPFPLGQCCVVW